MNITFTIMAHGFAKAAQIEKVLKDIGAPYTAVVAKAVNVPKRRRVVINKVKLAIILTAIDKHPDWNDYEIAREVGIGHNTVNRIRHGKHHLQLSPILEQVKK